MSGCQARVSGYQVRVRLSSKSEWLSSKSEWLSSKISGCQARIPGKGCMCGCQARYKSGIIKQDVGRVRGCQTIVEVANCEVVVRGGVE